LSGTATAPFSIKSALEQLIAQQLPAVLSAGCHLSPVAGLTGESWKIETPLHSWLARVQSAEKTGLGVERRREKGILRHVAGLGIAPHIRLFSPPWLVVEWLEGETCKISGGRETNDQPQLAALLVSLHRLAPCGYRLQLREQFARYWQQIDRQRLTPAWLRLHHRFMRQPLPVPLKMAVLHMDVHPGNLVRNEQKLSLIDWEYAAGGDVALELAALFRGNGWSPVQQQDFLRAYVACGGYRDIARLTQKVGRWTPWVDYLMLMWFEVRWQQTGDKIYLDWAQPLHERLFATGRTGNKTK